MVPTLRNDVYKYFQTPNHSTLLELPLKNDVYKYFQLPNTTFATLHSNTKFTIISTPQTVVV